MRYKSLTKWMKRVSDSKRVVGVKEDEATWALQLTTKQARACRQVLIHTENNEHSIVSTLTINADWHFFPFSLLHRLQCYIPWHHITNISTAALIFLSHAQHFLALPCTPQTLIRALRRAPGSENNGSARCVEPKVCSIIKMVFFWTGKAITQKAAIWPEWEWLGLVGMEHALLLPRLWMSAIIGYFVSAEMLNWCWCPLATQCCNTRPTASPKYLHLILILLLHQPVMLTNMISCMYYLTCVGRSPLFWGSYPCLHASMYVIIKPLHYTVQPADVTPILSNHN